MPEAATPPEPSPNKSPEFIVSGVLIGLTALIPHEVIRQVCAIAAPLVGHFLLSIGRVYYAEWVEDRRDESGIRRLKRYEQEIRKRLANKKTPAAERQQLAANLVTVQQAIHQFHIKGLSTAPNREGQEPG